MHTYQVTWNNGETDSFRSERLEFGATHIVFHNTENSLGYGRVQLVAALRADAVLMVEEIDPQEGE